MKEKGNSGKDSFKARVRSGYMNAKDRVFEFRLDLPKPLKPKLKSLEETSRESLKNLFPASSDEQLDMGASILAADVGKIFEPGYVEPESDEETEEEREVTQKLKDIFVAPQGQEKPGLDDTLKDQEAFFKQVREDGLRGQSWIVRTAHRIVHGK
jgi:hypothetical protein